MSGDIHPPVLDLSTRAGGPLPSEVPDIFDEAEYEAVESHEHDIEIASLLKDIRLCLRVGDWEAAKAEYRKLLDLFNRLPLAAKKQYFKPVEEVYSLVKHPRAAVKGG